MGLSIFEDYLDDIAAYFSTNYKTHTDSINTEKADNITLKEMKKITVGYDDIYESSKYPIMFLFPEASDNEFLSFGSDRNEEVIQIIIADSIGKKENKKTLRYLAAVSNMLKVEKWTMGGIVDFCRLAGWTNYPPNSDNIGVIIIRLEVTRQIMY